MVRIYFYSDPSRPLPPNEVHPLYPDYPEYQHVMGCSIAAYADQYVHYLDLLRNEYWPDVFFDPDDPQYAGLLSAWVPSGWGHLE